MSYGIGIYDEDGDLQLTSEASTMLFVDFIEHSGDIGAIYAWPNLVGKQIVLVAVPYHAAWAFGVTYPGGVPTVTTLYTTSFPSLAYVFLL